MKNSELEKKYNKETYALRDKIKCGLTCSTCMYKTYAEDAYVQESPDSACYCTLQKKE